MTLVNSASKNNEKGTLTLQEWDFGATVKEFSVFSTVQYILKNILQIKIVATLPERGREPKRSLRLQRKIVRECQKNLKGNF